MTVFDDLAVESVHVVEAVSGEAGMYELNCAKGFDLTPADVVVESMHPQTTITVKHSDGTSYKVSPSR